MERLLTVVERLLIRMVRWVRLEVCCLLVFLNFGLTVSQLTRQTFKFFNSHGEKEGFKEKY